MPPSTTYPTIYRYYCNAAREPVARCLELINRSLNLQGGESASEVNGPSEREEYPGYGVAVDAGTDGIESANDGALFLKNMADSVKAETPNEVQARLTPEELAELRGYLAESQELPLDWFFIPIR